MVMLIKLRAQPFEDAFMVAYNGNPDALWKLLVQQTSLTPYEAKWVVEICKRFGRGNFIVKKYGGPHGDAHQN